MPPHYIPSMHSSHPIYSFRNSHDCISMQYRSLSPVYLPTCLPAVFSRYTRQGLYNMLRNPPAFWCYQQAMYQNISVIYHTAQTKFGTPGPVKSMSTLNSIMTCFKECLDHCLWPNIYSIKHIQHKMLEYYSFQQDLVYPKFEVYCSHDSSLF